MKKSINVLTPIIFLLFSTLIFQACGDDENPTSPEETGNIVEVAQSDDNFSTLVSALSDAGLVATLEADGPFTVFAPTNDAFSTLPDGLLSGLTTDQLRTVLSYHVISGAEIQSGDLQPPQAAETAAGSELYITSANGSVTINDKATVVTADIEASNGVIHAIDQVILPDAFLDVVGIVAKRYNLETLETAVAEAGLVSTLQGDGPFTVFAPNNASFEGIDLSQLSQQQLQSILTYHVLPDEVLSSGLSSSQTVTTVNGDELTIEVSQEGTVTLTDQQGNTYQVVEADLEGTNGVVHIINGVLMPATS
jgi:transforming growth factor-beta-induced protein